LLLRAACSIQVTAPATLASRVEGISMIERVKGKQRFSFDPAE
jgi:hypothetical protein